MSGSSIAEHKAEYLKPSQLFREFMKGDYYNPVFLGFSFTDKHVRLAISDDCNANTYWDAYKFGPSRSELPRNDILLNKLVDVVQCLKDDTVEKYELIGMIVDEDSVDIHKLMDDLCKKGNFGILKYTCWKDNIATDNPTSVCNRFGSLFWGITFPVELSELQKRLEVLSAEQMLQRFLDFFGTLYTDEDEEMVDEDKEREDKEDKGLGMEDSKRKMIKYQKPLQFFHETTKRDSYKSVFLGLSFVDEFAVVAISDRYLNAHTFGIFPDDKTLLDELVAIVQQLQNDNVEKYEFIGMIVDENSVDIHDLMHNICKKGNFGMLKYTGWKDNITTDNPTFVCNRFGSLFWGTTFPVERSKLQKLQKLQKLRDALSAEKMLQRFLDFFRALYIDKDKMIEDNTRSEDS